MVPAASKLAVRRPLPRTEASLAAPNLPKVTAALRSRIGSSQIDEFVLAHGAADILRELVQNEFDGGGSEMVIHFGRDTLSVSGSGRPINAKGWTRHSVIMGTGEDGPLERHPRACEKGAGWRTGSARLGRDQVEEHDQVRRPLRIAFEQGQLAPGDRAFEAQMLGVQVNALLGLVVVDPDMRRAHPQPD